MKKYHDENMNEELRSWIETLVQHQDLTFYETSLKSATEIKRDLKASLYNHFYAISESLERAEKWIRSDLDPIISSEEANKVYKDLDQMDRAFHKNIDVEEMPNFQEILGISDESMHSFYQLGEHYSSIGEIQKAKDIFYLLLMLDAEMATYWVALGFCFQQEGAYSEALECYNQGEQVNPQHPAPYLYCGSCYLEIGEKEKAQEEFEQAEFILNEMDEEEAKQWASSLSYPVF